MDLWMRMDWRGGGSIISNGAWKAVDENGTSGVPESKVSVHVEWSVFEMLGTWDDKLSESVEKRSLRIRSNLVKLWVVDEIEKKGICSRNTA